MATWEKVLTETPSHANLAASPVDGKVLTATSGTDSDSPAWESLPAINDTTITLSAGAGMASLGDFTTNQSAAETITIAVDGVLQDLDTLGAPASDGQFIVATGSGAFAYESSGTARSSLGLGSGDSPSFADLTLSGDLTVSGATITTTTEKLEIADNTMILNSDLGSSAAVDAGIVVERGGSGNNSLFFWDESADRWTVGTNNEANLTDSPTLQGNIVTYESNNTEDPTSSDNGTGIGSIWCNKASGDFFIRAT